MLIFVSDLSQFKIIESIVKKKMGEMWFTFFYVIFINSDEGVDAK